MAERERETLAFCSPPSIQIPTLIYIYTLQIPLSGSRFTADLNVNVYFCIAFIYLFLHPFLFTIMLCPACFCSWISKTSELNVNLWPFVLYLQLLSMPYVTQEAQLLYLSQISLPCRALPHCYPRSYLVIIFMYFSKQSQVYNPMLYFKLPLGVQMSLFY